jgi:hypothetical protein
VVGKHSGSSIYDCAPQLCRRHRAKRVNQWTGDLASRRLRAYEPDGLDGSVLSRTCAYTYTHANSHSHSHRHAYCDADTQANTYAEVRSGTKNSANSAAAPIAADDRLV